jgi:hypothetical protein
VNSKPVYDNYEISGCHRIDDGGLPNPEGTSIETCDDGEAQFWALYGHITGQGVEAIGDFHSREAADEVFYRITGEAYGSHEQVVNRLRLMHAAPLLLEALEPYAIYAKNRMEWANGEDNEDAVDYIARKSVHAYTEATPRPPGADAVMRQMERLLKAGYFSDWDDPNKVCPDFAGLNASYVTWMVLGWENLDRSQQKQMLCEFVDWDGFDHPSSDRVKRNVLDRRPKEEWFAGLDTRLIDRAEDDRDDAAGITEAQIQKALADRHEIALIWSTDDVRNFRPLLNEEQAWNVLQRVKDMHDPRWGISWGTVAGVVQGMFPNHAEGQLPSPSEIGEDRGGPDGPRPEHTRGRGT